MYWGLLVVVLGKWQDLCAALRLPPHSTGQGH